jgi:hypothetical protein
MPSLVEVNWQSNFSQVFLHNFLGVPVVREILHEDRTFEQLPILPVSNYCLNPRYFLRRRSICYCAICNETQI